MNSISPAEYYLRRQIPRPQVNYRKRRVVVANDNGEQKALDLIASRPIMAKELRHALNISEATCERLVRRMKEKGLITQHTFRGAYYMAKKEG